MRTGGGWNTTRRHPAAGLGGRRGKRPQSPGKVPASTGTGTGADAGTGCSLVPALRRLLLPEDSPFPNSLPLREHPEAIVNSGEGVQKEGGGGCELQELFFFHSPLPNSAPLPQRYSARPPRRKPIAVPGAPGRQPAAAGVWAPAPPGTSRPRLGPIGRVEPRGQERSQCGGSEQGATQAAALVRGRGAAPL